MGRSVGGIRVYNVKNLPQFLKNSPADIGIVAVSAAAAQEVADMLVSCGIKGILNYAPVALRVPDGTQLKDIEPVLALQSMTYYLKGASPVDLAGASPRGSRRAIPLPSAGCA